jgi:hypothetical protein
MLRCGIGAKVYDAADNIGPVARCRLARKWVSGVDRWAVVLIAKTEGKGKGGRWASRGRAS